jgi:signal transduction histidine kinase
MDLQRHLRYPQKGGGLFVEQSAGDEGHDLALAGCQRRDAFSQSRHFGLVLACPAILGEGRPYRLKECGQVDQLGKELDGPGLHRTNGGGDIALVSDKDDWRIPLVRKPALQLKSTEVRQLKTEDDAGCRIRSEKVEVCSGRRESDYFHVECREECRDMLSDLWVVMDQVSYITGRLGSKNMSPSRGELGEVGVWHESPFSVASNHRKSAFQTRKNRNESCWNKYRVMPVSANEGGDTLSFTLAPAYYQTSWFAFLCAVAMGGTLWLLYILRLQQATEQIQGRLGARLEERERIARELHDTLLQGFQGLMSRFQAVMKTTLSDPVAAHRMMEKTLDRADEVLLEGRQRVRGLREEGLADADLSQSVKRCGEELAQGHSTAFALSLLGALQALDPIVSNEVYRIAREALINAFQHARASSVEAELTYGRDRVCLRIRDDGVGIDPQILSTGKAGHWGLSGMRERAQKIGAQLNIWSHSGAGTEVELAIPAKVAYPRFHNESLWRRISRRLSEAHAK